MNSTRDKLQGCQLAISKNPTKRLFCPKTIWEFQEARLSGAREAAAERYETISQGTQKGLSRFRETIFSVVSKHLWLSKFDDGTQGILSRATRGIHSSVFNTTDLADVDTTMQKSPVCYLDAQQ